VVVVDNQDDGTNVAGAGNGEAPQNPGAGVPQNPGPSTPPPRRQEAPTSMRNWLKRVSSRLSSQRRPASTSMPTSTSTIQTHLCVRVRSSSQPRRYYGPCPLPRRPRRETCTARRRRSSSKRPCNMPEARRPAYASRVAPGMTAARRAKRHPSTQTVRQGNRPTRAEPRSGSGSLIRVDRLRTATPATSSTRAERATQKHGRRQATTPGGVDATTTARIARRHQSPRGPVCSAGNPHDELPSALPPAHLDRQVHGGDRPSCVAQRLSPGVPAGRRHHR
jgi:hypothetical protein